MRPSLAGVRLSLIIAFASFAFAAHAQVVRTWVSSGGVDNPSCSRSSPCRTFGAAIDVVDPAGEVIVLDSGGYGAFVVTKGVSVIAPAGIHAAVAPTAGTGVLVAAGANDSVRLVNLQLTSHGASSGIELASAGSLSVESCSVDGFSTGIGTSGNRMTIVDSLVAGSADWGVILNGGVADLNVERSRFERNGTGLYAGIGSRIVVSDSLFAGNNGGISVVGLRPGVWSAELLLEDCTVSFNGQFGVSVSGDVSEAPTSATLRLSHTTILSNPTGLMISGGGTGHAIVYSRGDNTIRGNVMADIAGGSLTSEAGQ